MSPFHILIIVPCVIVSVIAGIWMLIAAFRQSVVWGLVYLFVPFGAWVFIFLHWSVVKTAFLTSLAAAALMFGILFSDRDFLAAIGKSGYPAFASSHEKKAKELTEKIQEQRDRVERLQGAYAAADAEVTRQYKALTERRRTLKANDQAAVRSFNLEAAAYQQQNTKLGQAKRDMDAAAGQVNTLLHERAKEMKGMPPAGKQVVMYTTSTCPACRAAKDYFAQKGVNYREIDVNSSADGRAEFQRLGGQGVPLILVGSRRMDGFNSQALDTMLRD